MLWRRPSATNLSLTILSVYALVLSIMPGYLQLKLALLWAWWQFFVIWPLQDAFPQYRRALNPFWYLLWNVSTRVADLKMIVSRGAPDQSAVFARIAGSQRCRFGIGDPQITLGAFSN